MTTVQAPSELNWDPPGPGSWHIDAVHHPLPVTRYWVETHPEPFGRGVREFMSFYGLLLEQLEVGYVNGFAYHATRVVPDEEVPSRFARAEEVFAEKLWREQVRSWEEDLKPASISAHRELQSVDPDAMADEDLTAYLGRCRDHHTEMIYQHMRFTGAAMISIGDLLAHVGEWTGLRPRSCSA